MAKDVDGREDGARIESGPVIDDADPHGGGRRLLSGLARRLQNPRQLTGDAVDVMTAVLETSDRAKTEMVKMVAREVRNYLEELRLKDDVKALLTGHSLEVRLSLSLKPLAGEETPAPAKAKGRKGAGEALAAADKVRPARAAATPVAREDADPDGDDDDDELNP